MLTFRVLRCEVIESRSGGSLHCYDQAARSNLSLGWPEHSGPHTEKEGEFDEVSEKELENEIFVFGKWMETSRAVPGRLGPDTGTLWCRQGR